jgi:cytochrome c553
MVFGLSTGHEIGLAGTGAAFIVFALISSFVLPARIPNFPGKYRNVYLVVCVCFFAAMISAVLVFGKESKSGEASAAPPPAGSTTTTTSGGGGQVQGNVTLGATIFKTKGCSGCHTLKAAGATGTVGPNLDQLKPAYAAVVTQVTNGGGVMPSFKGSLSTAQIQDVAAYVYTSTH